jgi:hypothetical protein
MTKMAVQMPPIQMECAGWKSNFTWHWTGPLLRRNVNVASPQVRIINPPKEESYATNDFGSRNADDVLRDLGAYHRQGSTNAPNQDGSDQGDGDGDNRGSEWYGGLRPSNTLDGAVPTVGDLKPATKLKATVTATTTPVTNRTTTAGTGKVWFVQPASVAWPVGFHMLKRSFKSANTSSIEPSPHRAIVMNKESIDDL